VAAHTSDGPWIVGRSPVPAEPARNRPAARGMPVGIGAAPAIRTTIGDGKRTTSSRAVAAMPCERPGAGRRAPGEWARRPDEAGKGRRLRGRHRAFTVASHRGGPPWTA